MTLSEPIKELNLSIAPMLVSIRRDYSATDADGSGFVPHNRAVPSLFARFCPAISEIET